MIVMFQQLSNRTLLEAYENAVFLRLDEEFINLLKKELQNRGVFLADRKNSSLLTYQNN